MPETFLTADGLCLAHDARGQGKPLLCLAGLTRNMADFEPLMQAMPGECRFIRLDSRGRGLSDHASDPRQYTIMTEARDALALMDHLGLAQVTVLGTSRGGLLALTMALLAPGRLAGVILNDIGPEVAPAGLSRIMDYLGKRPGFADFEAAGAGLAATQAADFPDVTAAQWRDQARRMWRQAPDGLDLRYDPALRTALAGPPAGPAPDLWAGFDALAGLPVAVIRGAHSDILTAETVARMAARHPGLIEAVVPRRGHVPFLDEAESLAAIRAVLRAT